MLSARTSFAALTTEFATQTRRVYAAVELLGYASISLTLETARSRNLVSASFYLLSKLAIQLVNETDGKFRVLENSKLDLIENTQGKRTGDVYLQRKCTAK